MEKPVEFYLSSNEGYDLEKPRKCHILSRHSYAKQDDFALIAVSPPIIYTDQKGNEEKLNHVLIASRHLGFSVFEPKKWPICVYVLKLNIENPAKHLRKDDFINIAWAEIYPDKR